MAERFPHKFADAVGSALSDAVRTGERCSFCGRPFAATAHEQTLSGYCQDHQGFGCLRSRIAKLTATNAALIELCEEYEAQWGDDYLAKKWGLKETLAKLKEEMKDG